MTKPPLELVGPEADMGVIVARFQTPYLTEGHRALIESVRERHPKFAILLGVAPVIPSRVNPLDYGTRLKMIQESYPGAEVYPIHDQRSNVVWSYNLDSFLRMIHPHEKIVLYGSRNSFVDLYSGKLKTAVLDEIHGISATAARLKSFHEVRESEDFRRGVCYATANQYRKNVLCVDVAVVDIQKEFRVLLGRRRSDDGLWRFIGGHVNVGTETAEAAGRREVLEEASCAVQQMDYIGSTPIDDWKYTGTNDAVFTIFFAGHYLSGPVIAGDDIDFVEWLNFADLTPNYVVPEHRVLLEMFEKHYL